MLILVVKCLMGTSCFLPFTGCRRCERTAWTAPWRPEQRKDQRTRPHLMGELREHDTRTTQVVKAAPSASLLFFPSRETTEAEPPSERRDLESPGTPAREDLGASSKPQVRHSCCTVTGCSNDS